MMEETINKVCNIINNMKYIKLLLTEGHEYVPPLNTYRLVMGRLYELKKMLIEENETS